MTSLFPLSSAGRASGCGEPERRDKLSGEQMKGVDNLVKRDTRVYADRRQYLIAAVYKRRKKIRQLAVEYKGGQCEHCGYKTCIDALEFHHSDPSEKDFSISEKGYTRSWAKIKEELDKCVLLCANCHRELHAQTQLPRETADETAGELLEARPSDRG